MIKKISTDLRTVADRLVTSSVAELIKDIASESKVEAHCENTYKGWGGTREDPPESPEIEVTEAYIVEFPELSVEAAEDLPRQFKISIPAQVTDEYDNHYEIICHFDVHVKNKHLLPNGDVEIEFTEKLKDWKYA